MVILGVDVPNIYWFGVLGSAAVELAAALQAAGANDGALPAKYHKPLFLVLRALFALVAGTVPIALSAQNLWSALYLGASAPLIFDRAARGLDSSSGSK